MTGKHVKEEIVTSSCPSSFGNKASSFYNTLMQREDKKNSGNILNKNHERKCIIGMISTVISCGWNDYPNDNLQGKVLKSVKPENCKVSFVELKQDSIKPFL